MWEEYNPNPISRRVGDCAVRAVAKALDHDWETAYTMLVANGFLMGDMPSSDSVWGATLRQHGFIRESVPNTCPDCYTAEDFANDHPSRDGSEMARKLREMMNEATDEGMKAEIRRLAEKMESM